MVVLTIIAPSSKHTVYFKEPLSNPSYIHLLSASLYNSWFNLKKEEKYPGLLLMIIKKQLSGYFLLGIIILIKWQKNYKTYSQTKRLNYKPK